MNAFANVSRRSQKVVIEWSDGNGWSVMFDDGAVRFFATPEDALRKVQRAAARGNKGITVTTIEWRNTPEGFVPPKGQL